MDVLFTKDYMLLWALVLALVLFIPVRQLIWVLQMRRARRQGETNEADARRLKRRAGVTAALLCVVFSLLYTQYLFQASP